MPSISNHYYVSTSNTNSSTVAWKKILEHFLQNVFSNSFWSQHFWETFQFICKNYFIKQVHKYIHTHIMVSHFEQQTFTCILSPMLYRKSTLLSPVMALIRRPSLQMEPEWYKLCHVLAETLSGIASFHYLLSFSTSPFRKLSLSGCYCYLTSIMKGYMGQT